MGGAGVALWSEPDEAGRRRCLAQISLAAPRLVDSMRAEAAGLATALALIVACLPQAEPLEVMGDNLAVLRLSAGNARIRADAVWSELEGTLMHTAGQRWPIIWTAVRRSFNGAADALATQGVLEALRRGAAGDLSDLAHVWLDDVEFARRGWHRPTTLALRPRTRILRAARPLAVL